MDYREIKLKEVLRCVDTYLYRYDCPVCNQETLTGIKDYTCSECEVVEDYVFNSEFARYKNVIATPDEKRRKRITKATARRLLAFFSGLCAYCEEDVEFNYHIDHVLPLSAGGTSDFENLVISCPPCNLNASNKVFANFSDKQEYILKARDKLA